MLAVRPMARTKQTARKCSGGGSRFRKETPPDPVPSDTRLTGKAYLESLKQLAAQSPIATEQGAALTAGAKQSISDTRTALPDLGPDLLQRIFAKLGPHPKDLVPLGAVSKHWREVLNESTWKELCLKHAGGLVEELGYGQGADGPPGGWAGLYKLLVYCPGCHLPTFEPVLQAESLSQNYDWTHGRGHVEAVGKGFGKGQEVKRALYLATLDEIVMSRLCSHIQAVEMCDIHEESAPPILACRGFVKRFESSELAKLSGAAAHLSQRMETDGAASGAASGSVESLAKGSEVVEAAAVSDLEAAGCEVGDEEIMDEEGTSNADSSDGASSERDTEGETEAEGEASSDLKEPKERPPCLYCGSPTFALPRQAFDSRFSDYDDMMRESVHEGDERHEQGDFSDESDDDDSNSVFTLGTGFVCLSGHIVLGMAGYPKMVETVVPHSGESLKLQRPQAVDFLLRIMVGDDTLEREEGQRFVQGLGLDQLIQIEARLEQLRKVWPLEEEGSDDINESMKDPKESIGVSKEIRYKTFEYMYMRGSSSAGIVDLLRAGVPADCLKTLQDFVLTGKTSLAECERSILEEFEIQRRKREEDKARKFRSGVAEEALREAGFKQSKPPHFRDLPSGLSTIVKGFIERGEPSLEESRQLIWEEREMLKQQEERRTALELRRKTIYPALQQAGFNPSLVPHLLSLNAYLNDPGAISTEEVIAQQVSARAQSVEHRVEMAAPRPNVQEESKKCKVITNGRLCGNPGAKGCSNGGCGPCCRTSTEPCRLGKHRKT